MTNFNLVETCQAEAPLLMGVINITPDSYHEASRHPDVNDAIECAQKMTAAGAQILDIGGESTRPPQLYNPDAPPQSFQVPVGEELRRVVPVLEALRDTVDTPVSIDTMKPEVARRAVELGACMINDVNGFRDPEMRAVAAEGEVAICIMHRQGSAATMQIDPQYPNGVVDTILRFFEEQIASVTAIGVREENICLDPGFCFGKTIAHNVEIIQNVQKLRALGFPLLMGVSRKSGLAMLCDKPAPGSLAATLAMNTILAKEGVEILRVHDVEEHRDMVSILRGIGYTAPDRMPLASSHT